LSDDLLIHAGGEEKVMEHLGPQVETTELAQCADGFVAWLGRLGYSPKTCQAQTALLRHLARWLAEQRVPLSGLSSEVAGEYVAVRRQERSFLRSARALVPLLSYLRELGAVPLAAVVVPREPVDVLLARFGGWLSRERGLAPATVSSYLCQARPFADACPGQFEALTALRVAGLATEGAEGLRPRSAQVRANAVRALLRFAWLEGLTAVPLAEFVGSFAAPAGPAVPKGLSPAQSAELLTFVREAPGGLRNEPMIALLLRLALRAGEAAGLLLDDIAWRQGVVTVRGKGNRVDRVPLPADVGGPLARYLRDGRPAGTASRQVFLALGRTPRAGDPRRGDERRGPGPARCRDQRERRRPPAPAYRGLRRAHGRGRPGRGRGTAAARRPAGDRRLCPVRPGRAAVGRPALAGRGTAMSTDLREAIAGHLAERRARGYRLEGREQLLGAFLDSMEARGETRITVPAAVAFATAPSGTARAWRAQRLAAVRSFAGYVRALDPAAADLVPAGLIPGRIPRRVPYLHSGEETARLMAAAGTLPSPVIAASMRTLIGLMASTGIRSGEAFALDATDLDIAAQTLTITGKYGRKRLIALHPSAADALSGYLRFREQHAADGAAALLIGRAGRRLNRTMAIALFRSLATGCGLERPGCRSPRLHDFRHSFRRQHPHRRIPPGL
jgi:integrase/recombinase XerD